MSDYCNRPQNCCPPRPSGMLLPWPYWAAGQARPHWAYRAYGRRWQCGYYYH